MTEMGVGLPLQEELSALQGTQHLKGVGVGTYSLGLSISSVPNSLPNFTRAVGNWVSKAGASSKQGQGGVIKGRRQKQPPPHPHLHSQCPGEGQGSAPSLGFVYPYGEANAMNPRQ
jgi:hypothetical protein